MEIKHIIGLIIALVIVGIFVYRMLPAIKEYFKKLFAKKTKVTEDVKIDSEEPK
jgi:archaellum biogenesis protein FlaJ (TadC family)